MKTTSWAHPARKESTLGNTAASIDLGDHGSGNEPQTIGHRDHSSVIMTSIDIAGAASTASPGTVA